MAFGDYDVEYDQLNEGFLNSQPNADAKFNSSLASPLTTDGDYCREHFHQPSGNHLQQEKNAIVRRWIKASFAGGAYVSPPSTKAISLRAKLRWSHTGTHNPVPWDGFFGSMSCIGVAIYAPLAANSFGGGYELMLQNDGTPGAVRLVLRAGPALSQPRNGSINVQVVCSGSYFPDLWYHVRLDMVPNGANQKTMTAYTSVDDGASWSPVGSMVFDNTDGPLWLTTGRCGFSSMHSNFKSGGGAIASLHYIDKFQPFQEDV
jgi:hypothetical protein